MPQAGPHVGSERGDRWCHTCNDVTWRMMRHAESPSSRDSERFAAPHMSVLRYSLSRASGRRVSGPVGPPGIPREVGGRRRSRSALLSFASAPLPGRPRQGAKMGGRHGGHADHRGVFGRYFGAEGQCLRALRSRGDWSIAAARNLSCCDMWCGEWWCVPSTDKVAGFE